MSPRSFLRRAVAAGLRRVDRIVWRPGSVPSGAERLLHRVEQPFKDLPVVLDDPVVADRMRECNSWEQVEYIHCIRGDLTIDAATGFVTLPGSRYLPASIPYDYQSGLPSALANTIARAVRRTRAYDRLISFRDVNEGNYFHFINDVLTKIPLLERHGLLNAPVLIGKALHSKPFFRAVLPALERAGLSIIEQGNMPVRAKEVIFCKSMPFCKTGFDHVVDLITDRREQGSGPVADGRRVFLDRGPSTVKERSISNRDEVHALMRHHGFEVIDMAGMPLPAQMELLRNTRYLVAIHGAAETNMIFRGQAPMDVLELFPGESIPPHYYWLASIHGFGYQGLVCAESRADRSFHVPIDRLGRAMRRMSDTGAGH